MENVLIKVTEYDTPFYGVCKTYFVSDVGAVEIKKELILEPNKLN